MSDGRGNNRDRRLRKQWLLGALRDPRLGYAPFGGDGTQVRCVHCGQCLTYDTVEADRIVPGGSYRRENVQPSCRRDNSVRGSNPDWVYDGPKMVGSCTK